MLITQIHILITFLLNKYANKSYNYNRRLKLIYIFLIKVI